MTIDAEYAAPLTGPMHTMLDQALTPYLDGDLDASDDLIDAMLEVIAAAEHTPDLIRTLHGAIKALPATRELMPAMHEAIGAALELKAPAPVNTGYGNAASSRTTAARTSSGTSREGSIGDRLKRIFAKNPGEALRVGDLVKALSTMGYDHTGGAVGAALNGMVARGEAVQVGEKPKRYLAADDPNTQTPDTDTVSDETTTPETDQTPDTPDQAADAAKTSATRRTTAKTSAK